MPTSRVGDVDIGSRCQGGPRARHAIEQTKAIGFDLIEIPTLEPVSFDVAMTKRLLEDSGLPAACSLGLSPDTDVPSEDPAVVPCGRDRLATTIDVTAGIGAGNLCGVLYSTLGKYPAPISGISRGHVVESVAWLADRTAQVGLTTTLEVVNRYETNVVNTVADMLAAWRNLWDDGRDLAQHTHRFMSEHLRR